MNKKGQMGETVTWVVATIIVVVILGISISIVSLNKNSRTMIIPVTSDIFAAKSLTSYLSTRNVYSELVSDENFNQENGELASKIFHGIYDGKVSGIWVGFPEGIVLTRLDNGFFQVYGKLFAKSVSESGFLYKTVPPVSEKIILNEDKFIEVYLVY